MHHVEWFRLFADREQPRALINTLLHKLASNFERPEFPVMQFYGVSGLALGPRQLADYDTRVADYDTRGTVALDGLSVGLELVR